MRPRSEYVLKVDRTKWRALRRPSIFNEVFSDTFRINQTSLCLTTRRWKTSFKMTPQVEAGQWSSSPTGQPYGLDFWCVPPQYETLRDT